MIEPIYEFGTWGRVTGVQKDGLRIDRPADGESLWQAPAFDCGSVTVPHPHYADVTVTIRLGLRTPSPIPLRNDDPRLAPAWAALVANGEIAPELLAFRPQPAEEQLVQARARGFARAENWLQRNLAIGFTLPFAAGPRRISGEGSRLAQHKAIVDSHRVVGSPDQTPIVLTDAAGAPLLTTVGELASFHAHLLLAIDTLRQQWAGAHARIAEAQSLEEVAAALESVPE